MFGLLHSIIEITSAIDPAITENSLTKWVPHPKIKKKRMYHYTSLPAILILNKEGFLLSKVVTKAIIHVPQIFTYAIGMEYKGEQR